MTNRPRRVETLVEKRRSRLARIVQEYIDQRPAILDEQWPAIRSYLNGDAKPLQSFVKKHVGSPTQSFVFPALEARNIGHLDEIETWEFIEHHKKRLESKNKGQDILNRVPIIRLGINRKYESVKLALESLSVRDQGDEQVLWEMIPGVAYLEEANPWPGSKSELPGRVADQIRREGIEQPHAPGKVFAPGPDLLLGHADEALGHADESELAAFVIADLLERKALDVGLSPQERESFRFGTLLGDKEAGARLGRPAVQVAQEKLRARKKLHRSA